MQDDVALAQQEIVTLKSEADSFKRSLLDMYRKHINLISKLPEYKKPQEEPAAPAEPAPAPAAEQPPVEPAPAYEAPAAQPPVVEEPLYAQPEPQPAAPAVEKKKVDTVEFAIAPHPEDEPEEAVMAEPAPQPQDELPFQPGAGLYDEPAAGETGP